MQSHELNLALIELRSTAAPHSGRRAHECAALPVVLGQLARPALGPAAGSWPVALLFRDLAFSFSARIVYSAFCYSVKVKEEISAHDQHRRF